MGRGGGEERKMKKVFNNCWGLELLSISFLRFFFLSRVGSSFQGLVTGSIYIPMGSRINGIQ